MGYSVLTQRCHFFLPSLLRTAGGDAQDAADAAAPQASGRVLKRKAPTIQHPLAEVGGYKMPTVGRIGGAKGIGSSSAGIVKRKGQSQSVKASKATQPISKEEADAIAAREAAKQRVQKRTLSTFGLA